jgi:predicted DNA-binding transcriptional regulator YafY
MTNATYQSLRVTKADFNVAVAFEKTVHILYPIQDGGVEWREIEPHEVRETQDGNLIVVAMCRLRGERRTFRLDRISHYTFGTRGFTLPRPEKVDPEEITDWWTLRSQNGHEVLQLELNTDGTSNPYARVLAKAQAESGKVRAVVKAERGISIRRLRRKEVLAYG